MQWQAFLGKNRLEALELKVLVAALRDFLLHTHRDSWT